MPCGRAKIWDRQPAAGPTPAREVYRGYPFRVNAAYAERFADRWLILSAKYGLIDPCFVIPGPYDVSFNRPASGPMAIDALREQVAILRLDEWREVVGLGGRHYRETIEGAFAKTGAAIHFPFAGLPLGRMLQATRRAVESGDPGIRG